jgi:Asp-tRNA(Asn)/Glu-tRNA(Gln) amidotransferase A subunit family amidase
MRFEEYRKHDAVSLAELIAKREVSAKGVLEAAIARAEQLNPAINAIVHKQYEQALKAVAAGLPEGPLKGVPYLIKDLGFFETGEPATFGSRLFKDFVADHDTAYVTRCKKAGLVFLGRTRIPNRVSTAHAITPGTSNTRRVVPPAALRQRSRPAFCLWRMQRTAAARSEFQRRSAASLG